MSQVYGLHGIKSPNLSSGILNQIFEDRFVFEEGAYRAYVTDEKTNIDQKDIQKMKKQNTLKKEYKFCGKGLHSGRPVTMTLKPAPVNTGIRFVRTDIGPDATIDALAENVSSTARSTTISSGEATVGTIEHLLSALTGLGVDNVLVDIDSAEVPILDGSAKPYVEAIAPDGLAEQDAPRHYVTLKETVEYKNPETGAFLRIEPADTFSYDITIDFNSRVLGVQSARFDAGTDYIREISACRTFCFFHEVEYLLANNLIKGGDVDNALVIVEHPITVEQLKNVCSHIGKPELKVKDGYLNESLHFDNECARHKLLDLIGDLRLTGGFLQAKVTAYKSGHTINTAVAKMVREKIK